MKTTKLLAAIITLVVVSSCGSNTYTINGTVNDERVNGRMVYLEDFTQRGDDQVLVDSTMIVDGKFTFTGSSETPAILVPVIPISHEDIHSGQKQQYHAYVLTEDNDIAVELILVSKETGYTSPVGSSDGLNGELSKMNNLAREISMKVIENWETQDADQKKHIGDQLDSTLVALYRSTLDANKTNILGAYTLFNLMMMDKLTLKQVEALMSEVPLAKEFKPLMRTYEGMIAADATTTGKPFVDFEGKNIDGTPAKLSDYVGKGKYVLADFWASWCGPCTAEIPNLKYLHENYPDLVVLGVNVWDKEESFHKSIKEKGTEWAMLYASDNRNATNLYGVQSIPTIILFDPQGIIVDRTLRGEKMKEKIAEIFKK